MVGCNANRCIESLHLNNDRYFKHLIPYMVEYSSILELPKRNQIQSEQRESSVAQFYRVTFPASSTKGLNTDQVCLVLGRSKMYHLMGDP